MKDLPRGTPDVRPPQSARRPFQFSLRTLVIAVLVAGLAMGAAFEGPGIYWHLRMLYCFEQIRRENHEVWGYTEPDEDASGSPISVEWHCMGTVHEARERCFWQILARVRDKKENTHLREELIGILAETRSPAPERKFAAMLDVMVALDEPMVLRKAASQCCMQTGRPVDKAAMKGLLDSSTEEGRLRREGLRNLSEQVVQEENTDRETVTNIARDLYEHLDRPTAHNMGERPAR